MHTLDIDWAMVLTIATFIGGVGSLVCLYEWWKPTNSKKLRSAMDTDVGIVSSTDEIKNSRIIDCNNLLDSARADRE
jgi:hypothetical protein